MSSPFPFTITIASWTDVGAAAAGCVVGYLIGDLVVWATKRLIRRIWRLES